MLEDLIRAATNQALEQGSPAGGRGDRARWRPGFGLPPGLGLPGVAS